jgi:hypothetical protein
MPPVARDPQTVRLRVIVEPMPPPKFGDWTEIDGRLQKGQTTVPPVRRVGDTAVMDAEVQAVPNQRTGEPNFLGDYAHGTPADRFLYVAWEGTRDGERERFRRAKIRLTGITWPLLDRLARTPGGRLQATMDGVDRHGGPACGSWARGEEVWTLATDDEAA